METRTDDGPEPWFCEGPFPSWIHTGIFPLHRRRIRIRTIQLVLLQASAIIDVAQCLPDS